MDLKDFSFDLPEELIAQHPMPERDKSRLMVLGKNDGSIKHEHFYNITDYLKPGDCLILNNTRVIPARLLGCKEGTGGAIEFVLLHRQEGDLWEVILKPGRKAKIGSRFVFGNELHAEVVDIVNEGNRIVKFEYDGIFEWPDAEREEYESEEVFCYALRNQIGVLVDGTVVPCCLDHDGDIPLGNLFQQSLSEILASPRARALYDGFSHHMASEPLCRRCGYAAVAKRFRKK